jgi:DNA-binding transcriptional MocR family regulator
MARAYERAASAYARHMARAPQAALFEQLASVEEHIHRGRLRLSSADAALLDRLTEVRSGLRSATAGLSGEPTAR